jgi:hypothetical protein
VYARARACCGQVLSKNLLEANELLKSHQTQLKATQDKMKALEDHHIAGLKKKGLRTA